MDDLLDLLEEAREQLMEMWKVADDSVADYILNIEIAVKFIDHATRTRDRLDIFKALQKAHDTLEKEYDEEPPDYEYDDLVNRIRSVINEEASMKKETVEEMITDTVLDFLNEGVAAEKVLIDSELNESQKTEIKQLVEQNLKRPGFMAFTYGDDRDADFSYLGVRVDPQNTKNWARTKEEVLFRAPYRLSEAIQTFTKDLLKPHE